MSALECTFRPCALCIHSSMSTQSSFLWDFLYMSHFSFSCLVWKRDRRKIEREKRNGGVFCLSVCVYAQMHSHAQLLSPTPFFYSQTYVCMPFTRGCMNACLFAHIGVYVTCWFHLCIPCSYHGLTLHLSTISSQLDVEVTVWLWFQL